MLVKHVYIHDNSCYVLWMRINGTHNYMVTNFGFVCEVAIRIWAKSSHVSTPQERAIHLCCISGIKYTITYWQLCPLKESHCTREKTYKSWPKITLNYHMIVGRYPKPNGVVGGLGFRVGGNTMNLILYKNSQGMTNHIESTFSVGDTREQFKIEYWARQLKLMILNIIFSVAMLMLNKHCVWSRQTLKMPPNQ